MNHLTLAVAGGRKTQSIVEACAEGNSGPKKTLVLTFTRTGQSEVSGRLQPACSPDSTPEVMGWYAFLLRHWIRPYLPRHFPGYRLTGLNFDGEPARKQYATGPSRFLDSDGRAFKLHLSKLAVDVCGASKGAVVDRLQRIYSHVYVDEVQDLTGNDLHVLAHLMASDIKLTMVGDIRQSVFDTNPRDPSLKQFRGVQMHKWFESQESKHNLDIQHSVKTWRSNQAIADLSDSVFAANFDFPATESMQEETTEHDGVYVVHPDDVESYVARFDPLCLRNSVGTMKDLDLPFLNFGGVKGRTVDRVLIAPTKPIVAFLAKGTPLADKSACGLYVGITRAKFSVAFIATPEDLPALTQWVPPTSA